MELRQIHKDSIKQRKISKEAKDVNTSVAVDKKRLAGISKRLARQRNLSVQEQALEEEEETVL